MMHALIGVGVSHTHLLYCFFFFFSSRRRHTRFDCDWSSDVCSSDLVWPGPPPRSPWPSDTGQRAPSSPGSPAHPCTGPTGWSTPATGAVSCSEEPPGGSETLHPAALGAGPWSSMAPPRRNLRGTDGLGHPIHDRPT